MSFPPKRSTIWLLALASFTAYLLAPLLFPLVTHYNRPPLRDIRFFTPTLAGGLGYALTFLLLYAVYLLASRWATKARFSLRFILGVAALFILPLLLTYPINATDIYRYFIRGRVTAVYGQSSLLVPPSAFPHDPFLPLAGEWVGQTSPYGPLWETIAAGITILSRQRLLVAMILFKLFLAAAHLGCGWLIWHSSAGLRPQRRRRYTLLWAWNPALLLMFVMDGHNDALMLFWLILGYWLMFRREKPLFGFLVALLGPLTKPIAFLALPFFLLAHLRDIPSTIRRIRFLLIYGAGSVLLVSLAFLPFGSPVELTLRLFREATGAAGFSPGVLLVLVAARAGVSLSVTSVALAGASILMLALLGITWRTWQRGSASASVANAFTAYLGTAMTFRIWYSVWPLPWLLLERHHDRRRLDAGIWFLLTAHLSVVLYGHVRAFVLNGDQVVAHALGVPFTFGLPLILGYAGVLSKEQQA